MGIDQRFDFSRPEPLAGDVDGVVAAPQDVPHAVLVDGTEIAVYPYAIKTAPVGIQIALVVAPEAARHSDPWLTDNQVAHLPAHGVAELVDDIGVHTRNWPAKGCRFERCEKATGQNAAAYLCAAGIVEDRLAAIEHILEHPAPTGWSPRASGGTDCPQPRQIMSSHEISAVGHQRPHQHWRESQKGDPMPGAEIPYAVD